MASDFVHRLTGYLRRIDGTPLEPVRNGLLALTGTISDGLFALRTRGGRRALHPLAELVAKQVGEPRERWNLDDIPALRAKSSGLMAYLPSGIRNHSENRRLGAAAGVDAVLLRPRGASTPSDSAIVYLHGGGFVLGDAVSVLPEADAIATRTHVDVFVVDYPLSPEAVYPEALDRVAVAIRALEGEYSRLVLVGESAGANLAVAALLRDARAAAAVRGLVLAYGWFDFSLESDSQRELGRGNVLTTAILDWFADQYTGGDASRRDDPLVSPVRHPALASLPPALCLVGEYDPLLDDMRRLAERIPGSRLVVVPGMVHGFLQFRTVFRKRARLLTEVADFIRQRLAE